MQNVMTVIKHEIKTTLNKPSFWITAVLFPLALLGINLAMQLAVGGSLQEQSQRGPLDVQPGALPIGFVDETGWVNEIPDAVPGDMLRKFADHQAARRALEAGEIDQMVVIPADYAAGASLEVTMRTFNPLGGTHEDLFYYLVAYNLTGDEALAGKIVAPTGAQEVHQLAAQPSPDENPLGEMVAFATLFIFFFLITMSSGWMLRSVSREKSNRTAEVLLLSLDPRELMLGKIIGLSVVALVQMVIWVSGGMLLLGQAPRLFQISAGLQLPPLFLPLSLLYFALGYLMFASLMGALGALAPNLRDAGNFTFYIILPLMVPMFLNVTFTTDPGGIVPVILSLFPLTAPTAMLTRLAVSAVPAWQLVVSLALLALTTTLAVNLSARAFRTDTLLSSAPLQWQRLTAQLLRGGLQEQ